MIHSFFDILFRYFHFSKKNGKIQLDLNKYQIFFFRKSEKDAERPLRFDFLFFLCYNKNNMFDQKGMAAL